MRGTHRGLTWAVVLSLTVLAGGCATGAVSPPGELAHGSSTTVQLGGPLLTDPGTLRTDSTEPQRVAELQPASETADPATSSEPSLLDPAKDGTPPSQDDPSTEEEFVDPFAKPGESGFEVGEDYDPWEPWNSRVFTFNRKVDEYLIKPVAKGYNFVVPNVVQRGVSQMFVNIRFVPRLLNNIFQGKAKGAGIEMSRFLINSTIGIGGFFDPATSYFRLQTPEEDFGQTLGYYGVKPGPFLLLPLWPSPLTARDGVGYVVDLFLDPWNWFVLPFFRVDGVPVLVEDEDTGFFANLATRGMYLLNERSLNLETFQGIEETTLDLYSAVRNAYLQRRAKAIRE